MTNPKGELTVKAGDKSYRLHLGMSVLADLQEHYGEQFSAMLSAADSGKMPDLKMLIAMVEGSLKRHHEDDINRWLVDDIISENPGLFDKLLSAAFPNPSEGGEGAGKKKAAA